MSESQPSRCMGSMEGGLQSYMMNVIASQLVSTQSELISNFSEETVLHCFIPQSTNHRAFIQNTTAAKDYVITVLTYRDT